MASYLGKTGHQEVWEEFQIADKLQVEQVGCHTVIIYRMSMGTIGTRALPVRVGQSNTFNIEGERALSI